MLRDLGQGLLDLLFPPICILCRQPLLPKDKTIQICSSCQGLVRPNRPPFCCHCSRPLDSLTQELCETCQDGNHDLDRVWAATIYNDTMRHLIHTFKYGSKTSLRNYFTQLLLAFIETYQLDLSCFDLILPIPLHPARMRERGYNQSQLLGDLISQEFRIPIRPDGLARTRHTRFQARLSPKERWTNIRGAFTIKNHFDLKGKNVLFVDDLFTTGATSNEAARLVKQAGATKACLLALAITRDDHHD